MKDAIEVDGDLPKARHQVSSRMTRVGGVERTCNGTVSGLVEARAVTCKVTVLEAC
jgi:hypothetical protein